MTTPRRTPYAARVGIGLAVLFVLVWRVIGVASEGQADLGDRTYLAALSVVLVGAVITFVATRTSPVPYRWAAGVALATAFLLCWMIPAVGVLGSDGDAADLMYVGVLAVGAIGAFLARFRPRGMARALVATAIAQALVALFALLAGMHRSPISSVGEIVGLNGFFAALFLASAWLFGKAERETALRTGALDH